MKLRQTIKNTFIGVLENKHTAIKIISAWFLLVLAVITLVPDYTFYKTSTLEISLQEVLHLVLVLIAKASIMYAYIRKDILKEEAKRFQLKFSKEELRLLGYKVLYPLAVATFSFVVIFAVFLILSLSGAQENVGLIAAISLIVPLYFVFGFSRVLIKFAAVSIGDSNMSIKQAFQITKGYTLKLFLGQIIVALPIIIISSLVGIIFTYTLIAVNETFGLVIAFLYNAITLALMFADEVINSSYYANIYKNFVKITKSENKASESESPKKAPAKKPAAKKAPVAKKAPAKKAPVAKKAPAKKAPAKKAPVAKKAPAKKPVAKKAPAKK